MNKLSVLVAFLLLCGGGIGCQDIGVNAAISECGGFETVTRALEENPDCGDHRLLLTVDADAPDVVHLLDENVWLNCCGEHTIRVYNEHGVYAVYETDEPEGALFGGARCGCMCLFDFAVDIPDVKDSIISVRVVLDVTDDDEPAQTVWEGDVDLTHGAAEVLIREDVGWCDI